MLLSTIGGLNTSDMIIQIVFFLFVIAVIIGGKQYAFIY